jgi:hypothetical protein
MTLPFLVVHGAVVWKVALVMTTVAVFGLVALARRLAARAAARTAVAAIERCTEPGVVRGVLGGGAVATLVAKASGGLQTTSDHRDDELWIETGEGKVTLDGTIRVVAGTHAAAARRGAPVGTPDPLATASPRPAVATLATLSPGDDVIALGQLETVAGRDETDNRTNASARVLRPLADGPITLAAQAPRSAVPRLSVFAMVALAGLTPLAGWKIEQGLGDSWERACSDAHAGDGDAPAEIPDACELACAMPDSRGDALDRIDRLVMDDPYRDSATLDRLFELSMLIGDCDKTIDQLQHAERFQQVVSLARECGDRRAEHLGLLALGRFEDATAVSVPAGDDQDRLPSGPALILAGRWSEAAAAADQHAATIKPGSPAEQESVDLAVMSYRCLAELLRFDGGDTGAVARTRALAAGAHGAVCVPALAEMVPASERAAVLASTDVPLFFGKVLLHKLAGFAGGSGETFENTAAEAVLAQPDDLDAAMEGVSVWLAETAPPLPADASPRARVNLERWQAVAATLGGDIAAARAHAARAAATLATLSGSAATERDPDLYQFRYADDLPAAIALFTNDPVAYTIPNDDLPRQLWLHTFGRLLLRPGDPLLPGTYFGPEQKYVAALVQAAQGDGHALARYMGVRDLSWWTDADVMAVWPRVEAGRDDIARQLAWSTPEGHQYVDFHFPWSYALHAAARRSSLQLVGATDQAARWADIYKRYDDAFRDRKKLLALALWDL